MKANDIKPGNILEHKSNLWLVYKTEHTKPGKGGAFVQCEMKDVVNGTKLNERFRSVENVTRARLDELHYQYLYEEGDMLTFMDAETFEQITVEKDKLEEAQLPFLEEGMAVTIQSHEGKPLAVMLPTMVTLEIVEADPVIKGQTATSSFKPAVLANGVKVMVPPFIGAGDKIVVNTTDATYSERAK